jgi:t-SNARE complex subunit (syntaxin)
MIGSWNPHSRLEFLKVAIWSVFSLKISEIRKYVNEEIKETEEELNQIENLKKKVLTKSSMVQEKKERRIETIKQATTSLKSTLLKLRKKFSDSMAFVSRARWFEYGERSNKFFLNLIKSWQNQISKIRNNEKEFFGQEQVSRGILENFTLHSQQSRRMKTIFMKIAQSYLMNKPNILTVTLP